RDGDLTGYDHRSHSHTEPSPQWAKATEPPSQAPPYEGVHTDVVPHLTIGHDASKQALIEAADAVAGFLPIRATVDTVRLIAGTPEPNGWHTIRDFPIGG
ncbi:hypothetical protein ACFYZF_30510, partial [Micromonospora sp. NPDC001898]